MISAIRAPAALRQVSFAPVAEQDAELIVSLRAPAVAKNFLKPGARNADEQRAWLKRYLTSVPPGEGYYMILFQGVRCGTVRIYDISNSDTFGWGSWCLAPGLPPTVALYSCALVYGSGFGDPSKQRAAFDVHPENRSVLSFHLRTGAEEVARDDNQVKLELSRESYGRYFSRWLK